MAVAACFCAGPMLLVTYTDAFLVQHGTSPRPARHYHVPRVVRSDYIRAITPDPQEVVIPYDFCMKKIRARLTDAGSLEILTMESPQVPSPRTAAETALQANSVQEIRVACFCEENVWRLAYRKRHQEPENRYFVVFISNPMKDVPMFQQVASGNLDSACYWDYHAILLSLTLPEEKVIVWDVDSRLPCPCPLSEYLEQSFPYDDSEPFAPLFRLIPASSFLTNFSSDRMHMYDAETLTWSAPPPSYDCILSGPSNLNMHLDFTTQRSSTPTTDDGRYGKVLDLQELNFYNFADATDD
jgi:hypothetical protein